MSVLASALHTLTALVLEPTPGADTVPDPGGGEMPPGEIGVRVLLILRWIAAFATAACVGGVLFIAGKMAVAHRRGDEIEVASLGRVLFACLLIGSASAIVGALI